MIGIDKVAFKKTLRLIFTIKLFAAVILTQILGYWFLDRFYEKDPIVLTTMISIYAVVVGFVVEYRKNINKTHSK